MTVLGAQGSFRKSQRRNRDVWSPRIGSWMADKMQLARLPERCVTHGLRKTAARRLAEAGCSANEIGAITGHTTLLAQMV